MTHWELARWIAAWAIENLGPECGITAQMLKQRFSKELLYSDWSRCNADQGYFPTSVTILRRVSTQAQCKIVSPPVIIDRQKLAANDHN